jgi:hypothetical protein
MAASPSSSPRLPSPPPIAEDQLGPKSPMAPTEEQQKLFSTLDHGASRRIQPGTKADDMAEGPPLVDISEVRLPHAPACRIAALGTRNEHLANIASR